MAKKPMWEIPERWKLYLKVVGIIVSALVALLSVFFKF